MDYRPVFILCLCFHWNPLDDRHCAGRRTLKFEAAILVKSSDKNVTKHGS